MELRFKSRLRPAALVAVAIGVVAAGIAYASIPDGSGVIHGCYDSQSGQLRIYDTENGTAKGCGKSETALSWSQTGPKGVQGPQGPQGPAGPQGPPGPGVQGTVVVSNQVEIGRADSKTTFAQCPAGTVVTGGGFLTANAEVFVSRPEDNGWRAGAATGLFSDGTIVQAWAICLRIN